MLRCKVFEMILSGLAVVSLCAGCQSGPPHTDTSAAAAHSDAHYAFLFGQKYRTRIPLYLFGFTGEPEYQFVGTRAGNLAFGPPTLPGDIAAKNVGQNYPVYGIVNMGNIVIQDVVAAGAVLTIRTETHDVTQLSGVRGSGGYEMGFICELNYGEKTNYVFTEFIQSHKNVSGKVPNEYLDEAVVEKIQ